MKILPVQNVNVSNFKGLWSKNAQSKKLEYYPFSDETDEQISNNTNGQKSMIAIMTALPFSSKEFINYTKNRLSIVKQRLIERYFVNKELHIAIK